MVEYQSKDLALLKTNSTADISQVFWNILFLGRISTQNVISKLPSRG